MDGDLNPASRPSRLPLWIHISVVTLLLLSFVSGGIVWWGQTVNGGSEEPLWNIRPWLLLHGYLNPVLCVAFGYLLAQHIRLGWQMRANWVTGLFLEVVFAAQIVTGAGLYYSPEEWREAMLWIHRISGLLLPVALISHWIASLTWIKSVSK